MYLRRPGKTYEAYMKKVETIPEWSNFYNKHIESNQEKRAAIEKAAQGSTEWLKYRVGCCTSSNGAAFVGHSDYDSPLHIADKIIANKSFDNPFMKFGRKYEPVARNIYEVRIQNILTRLWKNKPEGQDSIMYRKHKITEEPVVKVIGTSGSLVHPVWHHIRGSPDGIVTINDIAIGLIEIKCSMFGVYPISKAYHHDQVQIMLLVANALHPTIQECDYISFDGRHMSIDILPLQHEYLQDWFLPRIHRFFFELLFPLNVVAKPTTVQQQLPYKKPATNRVNKRQPRDSGGEGAEGGPEEAVPQYDLSGF